MGKIILDKEAGYSVVMGGAVLGGGGGGTIKAGIERYTLAVSMGQPSLVDLDDLEDKDMVVTASAVGAPAAKDRFFLPVDAIKALELVEDKLKMPIAGIITNENGPASGVNGWLQSAIKKIPMIDCAANGRAHPTGLMGAMGIHRLDNYRSIQSAVGGNPSAGKYLEMLVEGNVDVSSNLVRQAAVQSGGLVMVVRDPLPVAYLKENAAPKAIKQAMRIGQSMIDALNKGPSAIISTVVESTQGEIFCEGKIKSLQLATIGGYDIGRLKVIGDRTVYISFWNEFMTVETEEGFRHATFPDLITLVSLDSGLPLASAEIKNGDNVAVLIVPKNKMILGKGACLPETIGEAEKAIDKEMYKYY